MKKLPLVVVLLALLVGCKLDPIVSTQEKVFYELLDASSHQIGVNGDTMHVTTAGHGGDTLVMVHGYGPYPKVQWQLVAWSQSEHKTLVIVDLLGFGLSKSQDTVISPVRQMEMVHAVMDSLGASRYHMIGHSYGGMVSTLYASAYPERIKSLVLVDPLHRYASMENIDSLEVHYQLSLEEMLLPHNDSSAQAMEEISVKNYWVIPPSISRKMVEEVYSTNRAQRTGLLHTVRQEQGLLKELATGGDMPTLLIWGINDKLFPIADADSLLIDFPNARMDTVIQAGHIPHLENPIGFLAVLNDFYDRL